MDNQTFLNVLKQSFKTYLSTSERSNEKLKVLHGQIAQDIDNRIKILNKTNYSVYALGFNKGKEEKISGRYYDKKVDIVIKQEKNILCVGIKYIMSNYSQNTNNYFENMLGETANIRSINERCFQIVIIPDSLPYFDENKNIKKWENIKYDDIKKYERLSHYDMREFFHTPDKTLLCIINISEPEPKTEIRNKQDYINYYLNNDFSIQLSNKQLSNKQFNFGNMVIFNDYEKFIDKVVSSI